MVGLLAVTCAFFIYFKSWDPIPFNSERWLAARSTGNLKTCYRMSQSLQDYLLKTRPDSSGTAALLGQPDFQESTKVSKSTELYTYRLGKSRPAISSDSFSERVLVISFDSKGELKKIVERGS